MSRQAISRISHVSNNRCNKWMSQGSQIILRRWISVGSKSVDAILRRRSKNTSATTNDIHRNDNDTDHPKSATKSIVDEVAQMQRRSLPTLMPNKSSATNTSFNRNNIPLQNATNSSNQGNEPLSFFRSSTQQEPPQQQHNRDSGSLESLSIELPVVDHTTNGNGTTRPISTLRGPSNIPLRTDSSIFDVFQVPEPPQIQVSQSMIRSPNAYPVEAVKQYYDILEPIIKSKKFLKKHTSTPITDVQAQPIMEWLKADEPILLNDLPTLQAAIRGELIDTPEQKLIDRKQLQMELSDQSTRFLKLLDVSFDRLAHLAYNGLFVCTSMCARHGRGLPVEVIWEKIKESGIYHKDLLQNLLYVSATFTTGSARSRRKRRSKYGHLAGIASILDVLDIHDPTALADSSQENGTIEDETDLVDITDEIAIFHDLLFEPSEQSINIRVKLLVAQGKAKEAESLLDDLSSGEAELRLRAYTPVLRLFIELDDLSSALRLFRKMKDIPTVHLDGDAFMHLISGIAEKGRFRFGSKPIESTTELGYKNMSGPGLFDELIEEMAHAVFEIPEAAAKRLYNALATGFPESGLNETEVHSLKLADERVRDQELFASRVYIHPCDGLCPRSGVKLRLIHLTDDDKQAMVKKVLAKSRAENTLYNQSYKNKTWKGADEDLLLNFYNWLDQREGRPFTILIDGANVGYYHQNHEDGRFSYHQILFMVEFLDRLGENALVVLPQKYSYNYFKVSLGAPGYYQGSKQNFTREELKIRDTLIQFGKIFFVPGGVLDDFYWIVASVSSQTISRKDKDLSVQQGNPRGQWPGTRPVLITNDQMRDHQLDMLDPFLFRRWYSNYIVNYNFAAFVDGVSTHPDIGFTPADFFSREMQSCKDQNGSTIWHIPLANKDDEWFTCRIPAKDSK